MKLGIVGLPNVGKSTLFNSMTLGKAEAANYPFCTIDPNVGVVAVPDKRLDRLTALYNSAKTTPLLTALARLWTIFSLLQGATARWTILRVTLWESAFIPLIPWFCLRHRALR